MLYELYVVNSWTKLFKYFQHVFHFLWSSYDCCAEATSLLNKICPDNLSTIVDHLASIKLVKAEELEYVIRIIFKKAISGKLEDIGRSWHILTGSPLIDILNSLKCHQIPLGIFQKACPRSFFRHWQSPTTATGLKTGRQILADCRLGHDGPVWKTPNDLCWPQARPTQTWSLHSRSLALQKCAEHALRACNDVYDDDMSCTLSTNKQSACICNRSYGIS